MSALKLKGQEIEVRYDINALCKLEQDTGLKVGQLQTSMDKDNFSMSLARSLVWAGMVGDFTHEDAGNAITETGLDEALNVCFENFTQAFENPNKALT